MPLRSLGICSLRVTGYMRSIAFAHVYVDRCSVTFLRLRLRVYALPHLIVRLIVGTHVIAVHHV